MKRGIQSIAVDGPKRQRIGSPLSSDNQYGPVDQDEIAATLESLLEDDVPDVGTAGGEAFDLENFEITDEDLKLILQDLESENLQGLESQTQAPEYFPSSVAVQDTFTDLLEGPLPEMAESLAVEAPGLPDVAEAVADWRMRPSLPDDPKGYFTMKRFLDLHCPFINSMLQQMVPQGVTPLSVSAINMQTTRDAGKVLAVAREFLLTITADMAKAARIVMAMAASRENVYAQKAVRSKYNMRSPRVLLFFKDVLAWALEQENIFTAEELQALWEAQLESESPTQYMQILFGVVYMVYLSDEMKASRQPFSVQDQRAAAANLRTFVLDLQRVCGSS
jgi:uncharacterized protein YdbL (DUF1318 family)